MRTLLTTGLCVAQFAAATARANELTITKGESTAVIRLGDEIVGTYRFGKDLPKPYLIAVSVPDSRTQMLNALKSPEPDMRVFVAVENAEYRAAPDGPKAGTVPFGELLSITATQVTGSGMRFGDGQRWVDARDVVPVSAMVTRLVNLNPPAVKDRAHADYYDHPHHKGVWNSIDEVNGIKFWAEQGKIANVSVDVTKASGDPVELKVVNHWLDNDGQPLLKETAAIAVHANRLFSYDINFAAIDRAVTFEDTKEGMFAIRLPNSMREQFAHGPVVNADGRQGTKECWGRTAPWVDYVGPIAGRNFGVTIMDHPGNPRKSRYHVRDYGLFSISPFGQGAYTKGTDDEHPAEPLTLKPGESTRYRYGLYVHRGDAAEGQVAEAFAKFAQ